MHLHDDVSEEKVRKVMNNFIGKIIQKPPLRSAVKRVERERTIYYLEILEIDEKDVLFKVGCEAGTYIRTICTAAGKQLGTGAHMAELVRTKVAMFNDSNWVSLHDLKDAYEFYKENENEDIKKIIYPIEKAVEHLPKLWVFDSAVDSLCHGADLNLPGISKFNESIEKNDFVAIMTLKDELICVGGSLMDHKEILKKKKGTVIKEKKVFMERGIYPKRDKI